MSQENVEIVRQAFDAFGVGGVEAVLPFYAPDIAQYSIVEWPDDPVYRGHDGARKLAAAWTDNFDEWRFDVHDVREHGDRVVALAEMTGKIKDTDAPIRQPIGVIGSDFCNGTIGQVRYFLGWEQALAAVGLAG